MSTPSKSLHGFLDGIIKLSVKQNKYPLAARGCRPYINMTLMGARLLGSEAFYNSSSGNARSPNSHPQLQQI